MSRRFTLISGMWRSRSALAMLLVVGSLLPVSSVAAAEPRWVPVVIARGDYREYLQSLPIEQRPNRPLHFYGNWVRRQHARGATPAVSRPTIAPSPYSAGGLYVPLSR